MGRGPRELLNPGDLKLFGSFRSVVRPPQQQQQQQQHYHEQAILTSTLFFRDFRGFQLLSFDFGISTSISLLGKRGTGRPASPSARY